jgi:hypothetical protein
MSAVESLLAQLYTDASLRGEFLDDPVTVARREGLAENDAARLASVDREGLELAARSFAHKRASRVRTGWWRRLKAAIAART